MKITYIYKTLLFFEKNLLKFTMNFFMKQNEKSFANHYQSKKNELSTTTIPNEAEINFTYANYKWIMHMHTNFHLFSLYHCKRFIKVQKKYFYKKNSIRCMRKLKKKIIQ